MSHPLTWRRRGLWPSLQPATRGRSRCFGCHVVHLYLWELFSAVDSSEYFQHLSQNILSCVCVCVCVCVCGSEKHQVLDSHTQSDVPCCFWSFHEMCWQQKHRMFPGLCFQFRLRGLGIFKKSSCTVTKEFNIKTELTEVKRHFLSRSPNLSWTGRFSWKMAARDFVSRGQGPRAAGVLPGNSEKDLTFPDKGRISTGLKVQESKVTSPAPPAPPPAPPPPPPAPPAPPAPPPPPPPPHSHTTPLRGFAAQLKAGERSKTLCSETAPREGGDVILDYFTASHWIYRCFHWGTLRNKPRLVWGGSGKLHVFYIRDNKKWADSENP